jgi:tRNA threonylcarbamoyladenosine biosynthesis protein TsaB
MKLLALDTATEQCSVALLHDAQMIERKVQTARGHAELILPMIQQVLADARVSLNTLDALAFGRGPGAFTGVRIAVGVVQGLALGAGLPVIPVSNLAAVAQQAAAPGKNILVCMDARMHEVYWAVFGVDPEGLVIPQRAERVSAPSEVQLRDMRVDVAIGTGFAAHPDLQQRFGDIEIRAQALPSSREIAQLALRDLRRGNTLAAHAALPVYLRDRVAEVKRPVIEM